MIVTTEDGLEVFLLLNNVYILFIYPQVFGSPFNQLQFKFDSSRFSLQNDVP